MIICAWDTTSEYGSFALRTNGVTTAEHTVHSPEGLGRLFFPALQQLAAEAGISLEQVDCFASACGPGAFTGVRIGLAAAKGLAVALGKQAAGISNLRAAATAGTAARRAVLLDARRGDIYGAVYDANLRLIGDEVVAKAEHWLAALPEVDGSGYEVIIQPGLIIPLGEDARRFRGLGVRSSPRYLAEAIAICAERDAESGSWGDPATLDANYVRRSDAESYWKDNYVPKT